MLVKDHFTDYITKTKKFLQRISMKEIENFSIGNIIRVDEEYYEIGKISGESISWEIMTPSGIKIWNPFIPISDERIELVEINEEWLVWLGFELKTTWKNHKNYLLGNLYVSLTDDESKGLHISACYFNNIKYVHQIQNVVKILTNKKLTLHGENRNHT